MLTLFHSPESRSVTIMSLIEEMGIADRIDLRVVAIPRMDGSGGRDPSNPHPEGKVPALVHDGRVITERAAIILHLTALFPDSRLAPRVGTPDWGAFAGWLAWYQGVLEPVVILEGAGVTHPWLTAAIRDHKTAAARLRAALEKGPWIMGETFSAVDILLHGPYAWFREATPDDPLIRDWVERCMARPASTKVRTEDTLRMAGLRAA
jgi:glutathione S-transferase